MNEADIEAAACTTGLGRPGGAAVEPQPAREPAVRQRRRRSVAQVGRTIDAAQLRAVAGTLPQGLQTLLGEGGARLSGGEGQRVRLGRALMQHGAAPGAAGRALPRPGPAAAPPALLAEARRWWAATTLLCVTHDVGETLAFGRVLVVDQGRIVEDGVPRDLALANTRYRQLLGAERDLRRRGWADSGWRRLQMHAGRLVETAPRSRRPAVGSKPAGHPVSCRR
jgi:hypothetical protein